MTFVNLIIHIKFKKVNYEDKQKFEYSPQMNGQGLGAGEGEKTPAAFFAAGGNIYPCFFRFSELLARTAEVIWIKSLTYFFTFSPLR